MEFMHLFQSAREVSVASSTEFFSKLCTHADKIMHTINMHFHIEEDQVNFPCPSNFFLILLLINYFGSEQRWRYIITCTSNA